MKKIILIILLALYIPIVFGQIYEDGTTEEVVVEEEVTEEANTQNYVKYYVHIGDIRYKATEEFKLYKLGEPGYGRRYPEISCSFVKKNIGGYFILTKESCRSSQNVFKGNAKIYLFDGSVINLIDRGMWDCVNNKGSVIYKITPSEIENMKNSNIVSVRYTYRGDAYLVENYKEGMREYKEQYRVVDFTKIVKEFFK